MMKKFIALLMGLMMISLQVYGFSDLKEDDNYYEEISYFCKQNVFTGYNDGAFHPDKEVTRAEFAVIMCRIMNVEPKTSEEISGNFKDVPENHWARGYIAELVERGIMETDDNSCFNPDRNVAVEAALLAFVDMTNQLKPLTINAHHFIKMYENKATELGIAYPTDIWEPITRKELAHMIYSALDIPLYKAYEGVKIGTIRDNIQLPYEFKDKGIEYLCSKELGKKAENIRLVDLKEVREINAYNLPEGMYVESIEDVINMPNLESVILTSQKISDISPLSKIKDADGNYIREFFEIDIYNNPIKDVSCLKGTTAKKPISFPYERNDNKELTLSVEEYCEMMDKVFAVTESAECKNAPIEEKLRMAHDAIIRDCSYTLEGEPLIRTTYSTIVSGKALCEGYARAYKLYCDVLGVENYIVSGYIKGSDVGHAWNEVIVDGVKKYVDVTNDDGYDSKPSYIFFLREDFKNFEKRDYTEISQDRFCYNMTKSKNEMFVTVTFNTFDDVKEVQLKLAGSGERLKMYKTGNRTWEYTYKEDVNNYFHVKSVGNTTNRNGKEYAYYGMYRRQVDIYKCFDNVTDVEAYNIEYMYK